MELGKCPPIFETRNVLLDHLLANVIYYVNDKSSARKVLLEISNNLSNKDIILLLENKETLKQTVKKYNQTTDTEKEKLGDKLFSAVSEVDSELCAQITGMLLELKASDIQNLLSDSKALVQATQRAKEEYLKFVEKDSKTALGEQLYDQVLKQYSDATVAGHLTGMLLELDITYIKKIISNPSELSAKLGIAYKTLAAVTCNKN